MKRLTRVARRVGSFQAIFRAARRLQLAASEARAQVQTRRELRQLAMLPAPKRLVFPMSECPRVSVLYVLGSGEIRSVMAALSSLERALAAENVEIIVVTADDAGAAVLRNSVAGISFAHTILEAAKRAKGDYVLWLGEHIRITRGFLPALTRLLDGNTDAVAAVPQVRSAEQLILAAGGVISGGAPLVRGKGAPAGDPRFESVARLPWAPLDGMLLRASVLPSIMDAGLPPALALARYAGICGRDLFYQPRALALARDLRFGLAPVADPSLEAARVRPLALVVNDHVPFADRDAGSRRLAEILSILSTRKRVVFVSMDARAYEPYCESLRQAGIEVWLGIDVAALASLPLDLAPEIAWISRANVAEKMVPAVRRHFPDARLVFDTVDLHFVRLQSEERMLGTPRPWEAYREIETRIAEQTDVTIVTTHSDADHLARLGIGARVVSLAEPPDASSAVPFSQRSGILFLGNYAHEPNVDGAAYLVNRIMPLVWSVEPGLKLTLAGSDPPRDIQKLKSSRVRVTGHVAELGPLFAQHRVFAAPLRFGAGVKGKIVRAAVAGLPIVASSVAADGTAERGEVRIADKPEEFAAELLRLHGDERLWRSQAERSAALGARYSDERLAKQLWSALE